MAKALCVIFCFFFLYSSNTVLLGVFRPQGVTNGNDCPCIPDYAGEDKTVCKTASGVGVRIGCDAAAGNPVCADLCFKWEPALGLDPEDSTSPNPVVKPTTTTEYVLTVSQGPNILGVYQATVFVVEIEMELEAFKPKVIAGNTTTPAVPNLGAQTFVNLDNDDNDSFFDNDAAEDGVEGGDDELVRVEVRLGPIDIGNKHVQLIAETGGDNVRIWLNEQKQGPEYLIGSEMEITDNAGTYWKRDLWVEGIA